MRTLRRNGATQVGATSSEVSASVPIECSGRSMIADLRFARAPGPQSIGVRLCTSDASGVTACVEGSPDKRPSGPCRGRIAELLSAIERDLADHLLAKVAVGVPDRGGRWWDDVSLGSIASLVTIRRGALAERAGWWSASGHSTLLAAGPLRTGRGLAALQTVGSGAAPAASTPVVRQSTGRTSR